MKALALLALLPGLVLAQPMSGGNAGASASFTASAASGSNAFKLKQGAFICYNNTTCSIKTSYDGTDWVLASPSFKTGASGTTTWTLLNSASTGLLIKPTTQLTSGTLFEVDNPAATNAFKISWDKNATIGNHIVAGGDFFTATGNFNANAATTPISLAGQAGDSASQVAMRIYNQVSMTAGSDRYIAYFYRDDRTNLMAKIDTAGQATFNGGVVFNSGGTAVTKHMTGTAVIDFASTNAGACAGWNATTATVTGAVLGDRCTVGSSVAQSAVNGIFSCTVSASDTAKFNFCSGAAAQDPASATYTCECWH